LPADTGVEQLDVDGHEARFPAGSESADAWGQLLNKARTLVDELSEEPVAAIALELTLAPPTVRLVHRGREPLVLELGSARVSVEAWRGTSNLAAVGAQGFALGRVEAGPGWMVETALPAVSVEPGDRVTAEASFVVFDEGIYLPVSLLVTVQW
jgi:hypothetical protein